MNTGTYNENPQVMNIQVHKLRYQNSTLFDKVHNESAYKHWSSHKQKAIFSLQNVSS